MTDLITRARREWCEQSPEPANYPAPRIHRVKAVCLPSVVAALLDVLESLVLRDVRMSQTGGQALRALAAIEKALEGK